MIRDYIVFNGQVVSFVPPDGVNLPEFYRVLLKLLDEADETN